MLEIALVSLILFTATLTSSAFGFGSALFGMPLLTLVVGLDVATPLVGLAGPTAAAIIASTSWRTIQLGLVWRMVLGTCLGIPVGVWTVNTFPSESLTRILGVCLIGFGLYRLTKAKFPKISHPAWAYPFGFVAGILGGAYNTNGPPVVIYGNLNRWNPEQFRANLQSYFLPTGLAILLSHGIAGLWTTRVVALYGWSLPSILVAIWLGERINQRLQGQRFEQVLCLLLIGLGVLLLV